MNLQDLNTQRVIWSNVLTSVSSNTRMPKELFKAYFKDTFISSVEGNKVIVVCESETGTNLLKNNFKDLFVSTLKTVTGTNFDIVFAPVKEIHNKTKEEIIKEADPVFFKSAYIDENFTFEKFIEGPSNKEARQAALLTATNLGKMYNPLYIQGDSGLGKTHLLHSIAHYVKENFPEKKVLCISSQNFFDEYMNLVKSPNSNLNLTDYLKSIDVLLIDDIQQLKGKEKTQDYFFDIYTYFINNNKQIVLTCDRQPNELDGIPNRLITRFLQGLMVSIKKPDFSTCKQILLKKIEFSQFDKDSISDEAIDFIAKNFSNSIRQLEGAITRLNFYATINDIQEVITPQIAAEALGVKNFKIDKTNKTDSSKIISLVSDYYSISIEQIKSESRKAQIALARQIAMYLIRTLLDMPYMEIAAIFNKKDHTTIMHSVEKIEDMLKTDKELENVINKLKAKLS